MKRLFTIALFFLITGSYAQTYLPLNSYISGGWNIDVIAEGSSPLTSTGYRVPLATNGSLSNYDFNYGDALNAQDFSGKFGAPSSYYLPSSGAITNTAVSGCTFQLQPYTSNNAVFVSSGSSASLTLTANADIRADELIFLVVNDNQYYSSSCIAQVAVHFSDATSESFIVQVGGMWSNNAATKAATVGRVGTRNNNDWFWMNSNSISLHYVRVSLDAANKIKKLTSVSFNSVNDGVNYYPDFTVLAANYKPFACANNAPIQTYYQDNDADGYGNPLISTEACSQPVGYVLDNTDCNDNNNAVHESVTPTISISAASTTICSGQDITLNANITNGGTAPYFKWYKNGILFETGGSSSTTFANTSNGDIYTTELTSNEACASPQTVTSNQLPITVNTKTTYYRDADGDGYGDFNNYVLDCSQPAGYVSNYTDCDDNNASVHQAFVFFPDADGDGYGSGNPVMLCAANANTPPSGYSINNFDCDDNNANVHHSFPFYLDADGDGHGTGSPVFLCSVNANTAPAGYAVLLGDNCPNTYNPDQADVDFD